MEMTQNVAQVTAPIICIHQCRRVASQRGLEQSSELGVSVRNVLRFAVHESRDDVSQSREGEVDLGGLLESLT